MRATATRSLRLGFLAAAFIASASCGGKTVPLGTTGMMSMSLSELTAPVPFCAADGGHRNACCHTAADGNAECGIYPETPFHACDPEWTTYPVPATCCDLADPTQCGAPPAPQPPAPSGRCVYACPPGYTYDDSDEPTWGLCVQGGPGWGSGFGWRLSPTSGTSDAGISSSLCNYPCPTGWEKSSSAPDLCVNGSDSFSQATGPASGGSSAASSSGSIATHGGASVHLPSDLAATGAVDGSFCALEGGPGGHVYSLTCSNVTQVCTCSEDGAAKKIAGVIVCEVGSYGTILDLWSQGCRFPL